MIGYPQSRVVITLLLLSILVSACLAVPFPNPSWEMQSGSNDYPAEETNEFAGDGTDEQQLHEEKRAVFRMGKRAMMRFGKRALMRFGKRSVVRLG